jgi:hypothetical protein
VSDLVHHEPLHRAPEVIAFEIAVTLGQAYLAGVCLVLALQTGQSGLTAAVLGVLALAAAVGYGLWLFGGPGVLMAMVNVPLLLLSVFALLASLQPASTGIAGTIVRSDGLGLGLQLVAIASAVLGIIGGLFLPGPRRRRWHYAHGPDTTIRRSPAHGMDALAERLHASADRMRASVRRLRTSRGHTSGAAAVVKGTIPTHEDIHGHEPTYELKENEDWDLQPRGDVDDDGSNPQEGLAPYRAPRR